MNANTPVQPDISSEEWSLIIELLERSRSELLMEIRHTDSHAFRDGLRHRVDVIDSLLTKLGGMPRGKA